MLEKMDKLFFKLEIREITTNFIVNVTFTFFYKRIQRAKLGCGTIVCRRM